MTADGRWAELIAAAFDVGRAAGPLTRVDGGISHALFRLPATRGQYAAKRLTVVAEQWWWDDYRAAARIEQAAAANGVRMPDRRAPLVAVLELDGVRHHWQLHGWCDGHHPAGPDDDLADRTGATLARLHTPQGRDERVALHPLDAWHEWLAGHDTAFTRRVRAHLPTVAAALDLLGRPGPPLTPVASHRDLKPDNVLLTAGGPVLLDWDLARECRNLGARASGCHDLRMSEVKQGSTSKPDPLRFHRGHLGRGPFGEGFVARLAEKTADMMGSVQFVVASTVVILGWLLVNHVGKFLGDSWHGLLKGHGFDPAPFILLNLVFSAVAYYSASMVMIAQKVQARRDEAKTKADAEHREDLARANADLIRQNTVITEQIHQLALQMHALIWRTAEDGETPA